MYCVFLFSQQGKEEIELITKANIEYRSLPLGMMQFLKNLPNSTNIEEIYNYLEAHPLNISADASLVYLKFLPFYDETTLNWA